MSRRWRDPAAFRAAPVAVDPRRPTQRQALILGLVLLLVGGAAAIVSAVVRPDTARAFDLVNGSVFVPDNYGPVAIDLASGKPTVRLVQADAQVGAAVSKQLAVTPLQDGTLLLNNTTGEFNVVDSTGFVVKHSGGVPLPRRAGVTGAAGYAAGSLAYIEQTSTTGTAVYLVGPSTVQTATSTAGQVRPRAYATMPQSGSTEPGAAVSAGGRLWLLVGGTGVAAGSRVVRTLSLPRNSSPGVQLHRQDEGDVEGPAALGAVTPVGGGAASVVLAAADHVTVWSAGGRRTLPFPAVAGLDRVLPVTSQTGDASFLLHGSSGWSVVTVASDGTGLRGPAPVRGVPAADTLAPPAASAGRTYTMDETSGRLLSIGTDGVALPLPGRSTYPLATRNGAPVESPGYTDAVVVARSSRVIIDSPGHVNAVVVFTDGTERTVVVNKTAAVLVSAAGGAEALTQSRVAAGRSQHGKNSPRPKSTPRKNTGTAVNNTIDCRTTTQKPHIPVITGAVAGSRSVALSWTYPVLSAQDCVPSTYVVTVKTVTGSSPAAPAAITVQGEQGLTVAGLFPLTSYDFTVTAYLGRQSTTSVVGNATTGAEGPAAPSGVGATIDPGTGNWLVSFRSCGTVSQGCVPAASWTVTPTYCDGLGVSTPLTPLTLPADPTTRVQPVAALPATGALLGRGLSFTVEGVSEQGAVGAPSTPTRCVVSSVAPDPAALQLSATTPDTTQLGVPASTVLTLALGDDPVRDLGGVGATVTFRLTGPDGTLERSVVFRGSETTLSARFYGVQAGAAYGASVQVTPPGGAAAMTLPTQPVTTSAAWPSTLGAVASCPPDSGYATSCQLGVTLVGLSSAQAGGETFDVTELLRCGTAATQSFTQSDVTLAADGTQLAVTDLNQAATGLYGQCTLVVTLLEHDPPQPAVFGGSQSPTLTPSVTLSTPSVSAGDFAVAWNGAAAALSVTDLSVAAALRAATGNWTATLSAHNGTPCGTVDGLSAPGATLAGALDIPVDHDCLLQYGGDMSDWSVAFSWTNTVLNVTAPTLQLSLTGPVPTYPACDVDASDLTADWTGTLAQGAEITFAGGLDALAGCSGWTYQYLYPDTGACGSAVAQLGGPDPIVDVPVPADCDTSAGSTGWFVRIGYSDTAGDQQFLAPLAIGGQSPTS